jgi:hypothetical protein
MAMSFNRRLSFALFWFCFVMLITGCSSGTDRTGPDYVVIGPGGVTGVFGAALIPLLGIIGLIKLPRDHPLYPPALVSTVIGIIVVIFAIVHSFVSPFRSPDQF